jgi:hypothetical protein
MTRAVVDALRRLRRSAVRVEFALSALQAALWLGLAAAVVGGALLVRRRRTAHTQRIRSANATSTP